jgi:hypothetical protein
MQIGKIRNIISTAGNHIFSVKFVKKDGSIRDLTCRFGVHTPLKGGGESTTSHKNNLMTVWDVQARGYRCVNLDTVISAKIDGVEIVFRKVEEKNLESI